jgi:uncharacterized protein (DUF1778 family)
VEEIVTRNPSPIPFDDEDIDPDDVDPITGMTAADYAAAAEEAYAHRDEWDSLEEVEFEIDPNVRSVVSVRFKPGEIGIVERGAAAAGVPFSTFIRNAALNAASAVDVDEARRAIHDAQSALDRLLRALSGPVAADQPRDGKQRRRKAPAKREPEAAPPPSKPRRRAA